LVVARRHAIVRGKKIRGNDVPLQTARSALKLFSKPNVKTI
jgi:hypothetical protein